MITSLYGLGRFNGAEICLALWIGCYMLYLGVCFVFPVNRAASSRKRVLLWPMVPMEVCDVCLLLILFPCGDYRNYGIGAAWGMVLLMPAIMLLAGCLVTGVNREKRNA